MRDDTVKSAGDLHRERVNAWLRANGHHPGPGVCEECWDFRTATDVVEGHNAPLRPQTAALTPDGAAEETTR